MTRILIIEDDPIIAHIYRTRLENEAYAVETCNDGRIGLDRVREFDPHAILLDIMLPPVNERWIAGAFADPAKRTDAMQEALRWSDSLIEELVAADTVVLGTPLYNFGIWRPCTAPHGRGLSGSGWR